MISAKLTTKYDLRGLPITDFYSFPVFDEKAQERVNEIISNGIKFTLTVERN